jgi:hypothetical protein
MRKIPDIKKEWEAHAQGSIDERNWNPDYSGEIRLTVREMRELISLLTQADSVLSLIGYRGLLADGVEDREHLLTQCTKISGELRSLYESR